MKMIYQIKHTKRGISGGFFLKIFTVFFLIIVFVFLVGFFGPVRSLVLEIFSPFLKTGNYFHEVFGYIPKFFSDKNKLIEENNQLLSEIENDSIKKINCESIDYENQKLREELGLKPTVSFKAVSVIAKPPQIPLDSLFLDKGAADQIKNGDFVLVADRVLIGKIVKTSQNRSTVALNSFADVVSYGFVARTKEPLEIKGVGGGNMEAKMPINFDIIVGDNIMLGNSFDYLVAVVGMVENDELSGFKNILMYLPVNVPQISRVFVVSVINE